MTTPTPKAAPADACEHGIEAGSVCFLCMAKTAPRCVRHGHPWYCGFCGKAPDQPDGLVWRGPLPEPKP